MKRKASIFWICFTLIIAFFVGWLGSLALNITLNLPEVRPRVVKLIEADIPLIEGDLWGDMEELQIWLEPFFGIERSD